MEGGLEEKLGLAMGGPVEAAVNGKIAEFGGLLSREAAVRLLCQEKGISTEEKIRLSSARASLLPFSFSARVDRVFPLQQFPGGSSMSVRLHISDPSGEATLVLWNEQAKIAQGGIFAGDDIECTGAYFRAGEISLGRQGSIARAGKGSLLSVADLREGICNVKGTVEKFEGVRNYADKRSGETKRMLSFVISSGGKSCRAVWWSPPADAPALREGGLAVLEAANFRGGELHLSSFSRVLSQGGQGALQGAFKGISFSGGTAEISIGNGKFSASLDEALSLFGIVPSAGVQAQTLLGIKSSALAGSTVSYSAENGRLTSLKAKA